METKMTLLFFSVMWIDNLMNPLFPMCDFNLNAKLLCDMFGGVLGGIDGTMLTSRTSEGEHQMGEPSLYESGYMGICQRVNVI